MYILWLIALFWGFQSVDWFYLQDSNGGVFSVGNTGSVTFKGDVEMNRNGVSALYAGGAVYTAGEVKSRLTLSLAAEPW